MWIADECGLIVREDESTQHLRIGYDEEELSGRKCRRRYSQRLLWHQRRARDMRPGQSGEIQKHHLRILDLIRSDRDGRGRGNGARGVDEKSRHDGARVGQRGGDLKGWVSDFVHGDDELVLDLLDPEGGGHLGGVGVGAG